MAKLMYEVKQGQEDNIESLAREELARAETAAARDELLRIREECSSEVTAANAKVLRARQHLDCLRDVEFLMSGYATPSQLSQVSKVDHGDIGSETHVEAGRSRTLTKSPQRFHRVHAHARPPLLSSSPPRTRPPPVRRRPSYAALLGAKRAIMTQALYDVHREIRSTGKDTSPLRTSSSVPALQSRSHSAWHPSFQSTSQWASSDCFSPGRSPRVNQVDQGLSPRVSQVDQESQRLEVRDLLRCLE